MLILDSMSTVDNGRLDLPFYHRGHLSLKSGTQVTLCLVPEVSGPSLPRMTEMIVSPVEFHSWRHLWRINAVFREQQGVVSKLLTIIRQASLNILFEESSSIQNRHFHEVEIICDASAANPTPDPQEEELRLAALRRRIGALLISDLHIKGRALELSVQRMEGLRTAWRRFQEASATGNSTTRAKTTIRNGQLVLPGEILQTLSASRRRVLMVSDTQERILRVFFPSENEHFTYVRISHLDSVGALADITAALATDFDIITSLTRVKAQGDENHLELLLFSRELAAESNEVERRTMIERLLSDPELDALNLRISYPRSVESAATAGVRPQTTGASSTGRRHMIDPGLLSMSTAEILSGRLREHSEEESGASQFKESHLLKTRLQILRRLAAEEGKGKILPLVFLSYDFERPKVRSSVQGLCDELDMLFSSGDSPTERRVYREAIINRIFDSDCFLGIWTPRKGRVSPWFMWEWGVAQAVNKPCVLLIDKKIKKREDIRITPEQHHETFGETDFMERVRDALIRLRREVEKETLRDW